MSALWRRTGYLVVSAAATAAGAAAWWAAAPEQGPAAAVGLGTAWAVQAPAFWVLAGRVARGERAVRPWVAGIAGRFGGLAVLAVAGEVTGGPRRIVLLAYAAAVFAQLVLESLWLWKRQPRQA